jgi:hypothetical protein
MGIGGAAVYSLILLAWHQLQHLRSHGKQAMRNQRR